MAKLIHNYCHNLDRMYQAFGIVATVDPVDANNLDADSDVIDMNLWSELLVIIATGVTDNSATNTVTLKESNAPGGSYSTITGKSVPIVGTDDNKQFLITLLDDDLSDGMRYVKTTMNNSAHSQLICIIVMGRAKSRPATDNDLASVQPVV